jgi:carbon-monoxide dehydrogenase medium subunit
MLADLLEYDRPSQLAQAISLLARERPRTVPLGGATALSGGPAAGVEAVLDLCGLGLDFIRFDPGGLVVGATTTLQTLAEDRASQALWWGVIAASAHSSATRMLRNAATVGGTVAAGSSSRSDLAVVLLALEARVRVLGLEGQEHWLTMAECTDGVPTPGILLEVQIPNPDRPGLVTDRAPAESVAGPGGGAAFLRVARIASDPALLHAAAVVEPCAGGGYAVRLAMGGAGWPPVRVVGVEAALRGTDLADDAVDMALGRGLGTPLPGDDFRASSRYRGAVSRVLLRRAIRQAADRAATDRFHPFRRAVR